MAQLIAALLVLLISLNCMSETSTASANIRPKKHGESISQRVDAFARGLDAFLSGTDEQTENKSRLIFRNSMQWSEKEDFEYRPDLDIRLHLPNLEKRMKLRFTNYDTELEEQGIERQRVEQREDDEESYGASLFFMRAFKGFDFTYRPRLRIRSKAEITHLFRFKKISNFETFSTEQRIEFFARSETGMGQFYGLGFFYPFKDNYTFGLSNDFQYVNAGTLFSSNNNLFINRRLSDRRSLRPGLLIQSDNEPHFRMQKYTFYLAYSHEVSKDSFRYQLIPRMDHQRIDSFSGSEGVLLEMILIF